MRICYSYEISFVNNPNNDLSLVAAGAAERRSTPNSAKDNARLRLSGEFGYTHRNSQNIIKTASPTVNCNGWLGLFHLIPSQKCPRIELMYLLEQVLLLLKSQQPFPRLRVAFHRRFGVENTPRLGLTAHPGLLQLNRCHLTIPVCPPRLVPE